MFIPSIALAVTTLPTPKTDSTANDRVDELEAKLDKALKALDAAVEKFNQHAGGK
jgi:hypothetical protein